MKPPPTPIIDAKIPIKKPITTGGIALMYNLDPLNFVLNGRP